MVKKGKADLEQIKQQLSERRLEIYNGGAKGNIKNNVKDYFEYLQSRVVDAQKDSLQRSLILSNIASYKICQMLYELTLSSNYDSITPILIPGLINNCLGAAALLTAAMHCISQDSESFDEISNPSFRPNSIGLQMNLANVFGSLAQLRRLTGEEFKQQCYNTISSINSIIINLKIQLS